MNVHVHIINPPSTNSTMTGNLVWSQRTNKKSLPPPAKGIYSGSPLAPTSVNPFVMHCVRQLQQLLLTLDGAEEHYALVRDLLWRLVHLCWFCISGGWLSNISISVEIQVRAQIAVDETNGSARRSLSTHTIIHKRPVYYHPFRLCTDQCQHLE